MKHFQFVLILLLASMVSACGATVVSSYRAQSIIKIGKGEVRMGVFEYAPSVNGYLDANEIQSTKMSVNIRMATDVADYVKKATSAEFERAGLTVVDGADIEVRAQILEISMSDQLFIIRWVFKINYGLYDVSSGNLLITKLYETEKSISSLGISPKKQINDMIGDTMDRFMVDIIDRRIFGLN